ncbi:MAG: hypothetical protein JW751_09375 [Polyangiaceae bacterium]|nr:hypothetical protein [Polyangiaceae bacterium]
MVNAAGFSHPLAIDRAWISEFESLAFTAEALFAHPEPDDQELGRLANRVTGVLADWEEIDADGRSLRREAIHAAAQVRAADIALEEGLVVLVADVLVATGGSREDLLFRRFFPEPLEDLLEMGLDASLPVVMGFILALDRDDSLPDAVRSHEESLRAAQILGNCALAARADALAALGRHHARVEAWRETAAATERNLFRALGRIAEARGLPRRWVRAFFLNPPSEP